MSRGFESLLLRQIFPKVDRPCCIAGLSTFFVLVNITIEIMKYQKMPTRFFMVFLRIVRTKIQEMYIFLIPLNMDRSFYDSSDFGVQNHVRNVVAGGNELSVVIDIVLNFKKYAFRNCAKQTADAIV